MIRLGLLGCFLEIGHLLSSQDMRAKSPIWVCFPVEQLHDEVECPRSGMVRL